MGLNSALEISASGIYAASEQMEVIASNMANINTTRTLGGGPYRRRIAVFGEKQLTFEQELERAEKKALKGVAIKEVVEDTSPLQKVYNPSHPDADENGFVSMPNVSVSKENVDLIYNSKYSEANVNAYNATKQMMRETLQIQ